MSDGKIALITGANRGIGFETARQLAGKGWTVWLGARDGRGRKAAASITGDVRPLRIDISDGESVSAAAEQVAASSPRVDALVNNAGILIDADQSLLEVDERDILTTFQTN